jgi:hypothetical protein
VPLICKIGNTKKCKEAKTQREKNYKQEKTPTKKEKNNRSAGLGFKR